MARALVNRTVNPNESSERGLDGRLIADLNDSNPALVTGSAQVVDKSSYNENLTSYNLLPELINYPPYFETSVYDASEPIIKPIQYNEEDRDIMYVDENGTLRVAAGTTFILRCKAQQPPIYNVENGKPTLLYDNIVQPTVLRGALPEHIVTKRLQLTESVQSARTTLPKEYLEDDLIYTWFKDDGLLTGELLDIGSLSANVKVFEQGRAILFENISPRFAGTYYCEVSNDIGTITTEQILLEVYNPDVENMFYSNLITNPNGELGTDEWSAGDTEFISSKISTAPFTEFSKPWLEDAFGYTIDMFYPRPYNINTFGIRNSRLAESLLFNGSYFTRENYRLISEGGKYSVSAEYDVDLTDIQPYIQGAVFGVTGVRAIFGCYIGNAITRFLHTIITAPNSRRNYTYAVDPSSPRTSLINALIAGTPVIDEKVNVVITEYDNETPLKSRRLLNLQTGEESLEYGIIIEDSWTQLINSERYNNINLVPNTLTSGFKSDGRTNVDKIIQIASEIYPNRESMPTHGQFVSWNKEVITKLNHKTNKIRIKLTFKIGTSPVEDSAYIEETDVPFEDFSWQNVIKPFWFPHYNGSEFTVGGVPLNKFVYNERETIGATESENKPPAAEIHPAFPSPRCLATGFNLVLLPLEAKQPKKAYYYTKTMLEPYGDLNSRYPHLSSSLSTTPNPELQSILLEIQQYTGSIIAIDIAHTYNTPKKITTLNNNIGISYDTQKGVELLNTHSLENLKAEGSIASTTTIATYKYVNDNNYTRPIVVDNITEAYDDGVRDNWNQVGIAGELLTNVAKLRYQLVEEPYIIYNKNAEVLGECELSQITGQLKSGLIKFLDNPLLTAIGNDYEAVKLSESSLQEYVANIGVQLDFLYQPFGSLPTSDSSVDLVSMTQTVLPNIYTSSYGPTNYTQKWKQAIQTDINSSGLEFDSIPTASYTFNLFKYSGIPQTPLGLLGLPPNLQNYLNSTGNINTSIGRQALYFSSKAFETSKYNNNEYRNAFNKKTKYNWETNSYTDDGLLTGNYWKSIIADKLEETYQNVGYNLYDAAGNKKSVIPGNTPKLYVQGYGDPLYGYAGQPPITYENARKAIQEQEYVVVGRVIEDGNKYLLKKITPYYIYTAVLDPTDFDYTSTQIRSYYSAPLLNNNNVSSTTYAIAYNNATKKYTEFTTKISNQKTRAFNELVDGPQGIKAWYGKPTQARPNDGRFGIQQDGYVAGLKGIYTWQGSNNTQNCRIMFISKTTNKEVTQAEFRSDPTKCNVAYEMRATATAGTWSKIVLAEVRPKENKMFTPAAIVFPKSKRIYYMKYNYIDNMLDE